MALSGEVLSNYLNDVDLIVHAGRYREIQRHLKLCRLLQRCILSVEMLMVVNGQTACLITDVVQVGQDIFICPSRFELHLTWILLRRRFNVVIYGHSHIPKIEERNGVLFLNPGSAGPRRFDYPISIAFLYINGTSIETEIVELKG